MTTDWVKPSRAKLLVGPVVARPAPAAISRLVLQRLVVARSNRPNVADRRRQKCAAHSIHARLQNHNQSALRRQLQSFLAITSSALDSPVTGLLTFALSVGFRLPIHVGV